ncbi:hypothetical protein DIS24_g1379 [Lasiodiplodia hormozganensis]|uniref:Uncharacterized protein n=1 Tax=Lasiodiplodia hormozganensis TaxID=869390 RepID=A0AA39Z2N6_9PEZI|nr:hypothetical protein DIS24_g1379 [Lasiodiplodia hormozganensis]
MEQTTSSDDPGFCLRTTINAEEPPPYSEQKNSSPDFDFDQAAPAEVEKQPRAIDWSDIVTASAWPQVILALLHIPTMLVQQAFLPILWQQLVATYLESTELGWWKKEMVGWVLVVAGGQLLILTTNLYLGEYAWPEASREEQRKALEKSLERRREAFEAEEEARYEYRGKWGGEGMKEQAEAGADGRQHGDACSVKDLKAGVDGKWEVTDELIATVFTILQDIGLFKIESG